jgi:hypothetical protein
MYKSKCWPVLGCMCSYYTRLHIWQCINVLKNLSVSVCMVHIVGQMYVSVSMNKYLFSNVYTHMHTEVLQMPTALPLGIKK